MYFSEVTKALDYVSKICNDVTKLNKAEYLIKEQRIFVEISNPFHSI